MLPDLILRQHFIYKIGFGEGGHCPRVPQSAKLNI